MAKLQDGAMDQPQDASEDTARGSKGVLGTLVESKIDAQTILI